MALQASAKNNAPLRTSPAVTSSRATQLAAQAFPAQLLTPEDLVPEVSANLPPFLLLKLLNNAFLKEVFVVMNSLETTTAVMDSPVPLSEVLSEAMVSA